MTIEELLAATGLTANDLVPIWDAEAASNVEPTQKITAAQFAAAVKTLANLQGKLTFDSTPTTGSTNPVTSGGVATAIAQSTANALKGIVLRRVNGTITDTTNGFIDTGISSNDYVVIGYFTPAASNTSIEITNLDTGTRNYRIRQINVVSGSIVKSGSYNVYLVTIDRDLITL